MNKITQRILKICLVFTKDIAHGNIITMLNKIDKFFIWMALSILFFYMLPFLALLFIAYISLLFGNNYVYDPTTLLPGFGFVFIVITSLISMVFCHIAYLALFCTLYKKIRESQKTKKDYWIICANVAAIIFYGVLAFLTWTLIVLGMIVD